MNEIILISWFVILLLIWTGWIRKLFAFFISIAGSLIPILCYFLIESGNNSSVTSEYFYLSPILLLISYLFFNQSYKYLVGIESDSGTFYTNSAKFSNRKLNFGDYIVLIGPIVISLLPVILNK